MNRYTVSAMVFAAIVAIVLFALPARATDTQCQGNCSSTFTYMPTVIRVDAAPGGGPWTYEQVRGSWFTYGEFFAAKRALFGFDRVAWRCYLAGDGNYNHLSICYVSQDGASYVYTPNGWQ